MKHLARLLLAASLLLPAAVSAETIEQQSGWAGWFNTTRFNQHWGLASDIQLRSGDHWQDLQNVLLRPGVTYFADANTNVTLGYAWIGTLNRPSGDVEEHRIWQQLIRTQSLGPAALTHRLRLEQRFTEATPGSGHAFSQRLRYFLRAVIPLGSATAKPFERGAFAALQNELFFNVQHRDVTNGSLFDQNRAYVAAGYRFSKMVDLELGYLNQAIHGRAANTQNHVIQLALYTRF